MKGFIGELFEDPVTRWLTILLWAFVIFVLVVSHNDTASEWYREVIYVAGDFFIEFFSD